MTCQTTSQCKTFLCAHIAPPPPLKTHMCVSVQVCQIIMLLGAEVVEGEQGPWSSCWHFWLCIWVLMHLN